jgi:sugar lactone lactonase YvrE
MISIRAFINRQERLTKKEILLIAAAGLAAILLLYWRLRYAPPEMPVRVVTLAGRGLKLQNGVLPDPFGVAVDADGRVFFSDGGANSLYRVNEDGTLKTITSDLDMPSAVAFGPDGALVVANTGAHTIVRVNVESGRLDLIAGASGESGDADGAARDARFNGPIGVAAAEDGRIFVADTYNDRIREIGVDGRVRTLAGSVAGFRDGPGHDAQFDTPCGIAVEAAGTLLVADTGNRRIRRVASGGQTTTVAGTGEFGDRDGAPFDAAFAEPMAIAIRRDGRIFIADAGGSVVRMLTEAREDAPAAVTTLAEGELVNARLNRPAALAFNPGDALLVADAGNGLIRALAPREWKPGFQAPAGAAILAAEEIRASVPPRWPFDPPFQRRDVAGTFGEIRGEVLPDHDAWFHNGFDIPGAYGETARAIFSERVTQPLAVEGAGTGRERLRLPLLGYIHIRIGRDQNDQPLGNHPPGAITFQRDAAGQIAGVRVRRGTRFNAGDPIGTLNRLNHVHLIAGPAGSEVNALVALQFPGLTDTVPPVIEGVTIVSEHHETLFDSGKTAKNAKPVVLSGKLRIFVRAYDQMDGNPKYRRLGAHGVGYQLAGARGNLKPERYNVLFERLPLDPRMIYAEGSQSGYEGATIFSYIATNTLRDGEAREGWLDTAEIAPGDYVLQVFVRDYFGNETRRELPITITHP